MGPIRSDDLDVDEDEAVKRLSLAVLLRAVNDARGRCWRVAPTRVPVVRQAAYEWLMSKDAENYAMLAGIPVYTLKRWRKMLEEGEL